MFPMASCGRVPRYAFITWLAFRDRLATGHRTSKWGAPQGCLYCGDPDETRDHLFFACPYTFTLWLKVVGTLFGADPEPDWSITITRLQIGTYNCLTFILLSAHTNLKIVIIDTSQTMTGPAIGEPIRVQGPH
ncbi:hypothetical protein F2Q70_00020946 [Brassica cretica]|uniref:Reverse transcriptase zinc-binding domain-containing protein n=2 Tax=Brassica cretica TaxID=69181 RepID=A0A8S9HGB4_BRACR|nr:hypothetical protein F2Q70_00020946 [Brassica cretica]KAF2554898.1 hypothetical protein F2Q68_00014410 [Brassica cretica]KAF3606955.1 hypothetical protein DY000_02046904 [Brassica cretica]